MSPEDKRKVANWLRGKVKVLRPRPDPKGILKEQLDRLEAEADRLELESTEAERKSSWNRHSTSSTQTSPGI